MNYFYFRCLKIIIAFFGQNAKRTRRWCRLINLQLAPESNGQSSRLSYGGPAVSKSHKWYFFLSGIKTRLDRKTHPLIRRRHGNTHNCDGETLSDAWLELVSCIFRNTARLGKDISRYNTLKSPIRYLYYGLQKSECNWFQSYLSNRCMHVNGVACESCFISTGALHGSILGPLLFIIFIHDLPKSSTFFYTRLYAGDKFTIDISWKWSRHLNFLWEISNHLQAVHEWLCNNIKLNLTKTKFLIFMSRQRKNHNLYPPLTVANVHLEKPFCVKYLGVYIDCHLIISWHDCIDCTYVANLVKMSI